MLVFRYPCPHWSSRVSHGGWLVLIVIMMLVIALGSMTYYTKRGNEYAEQGMAIANPLFQCCRDRMKNASSGNWAG